MRVVAIGGGTGLSAVLRGLKQHVQEVARPAVLEPTITRLTAVVTVTVSIHVPRGFAKNTFYQLTIDGTGTVFDALSGLNGDLLDGELAGSFPSGDGVAGGDFVALLGFGRKFSFTDGDGDDVSLSLHSPGNMAITREAPIADGIRSEALTLRITDTGRRSELTGRVTRRTGNGTTSFDLVTGLTGLRNNIQNNPSFVLGQVSALVVDRVLDSRPSAYGRLNDLFEDLLFRRDFPIARQFST